MREILRSFDIYSKLFVFLNKTVLLLIPKNPRLPLNQCSSEPADLHVRRTWVLCWLVHVVPCWAPFAGSP